MKKVIVVYYSRTGNNRFLAEKLAESFNCEVVDIRPKINAFILLLLKKGAGIKSMKINFGDYQNVILCGPIWMGKFISPLRGFILKYGNNINRLHFATCCGSGDEVKNEKFGHGIVFQTLKSTLGDKCVHCEAFPVGMVAEDEAINSSDTLMKIRLSDLNFNGEIQRRLDGFVLKVAQM